METLGNYLKEERNKKGISLEEIYHVTKISLSFLKDIEADKYDSLPVPLITRGFLRLYAKELGLDEKEVISRHEEGKRVFIFEKEKTEKGEFVHKNIFTARRLILLLILVSSGFIIYYYFGGKIDFNSLNMGQTPSGPTIEVTGDKPPAGAKNLSEQETLELEEEPILRQVEAESIETAIFEGAQTEMDKAAGAESGVEEPTDEQDEEISLQPEEDMALPDKIGVDLVCRAKELTWIRYRVDEGEDREVLLKPGENYSLKAEKGIELLVGNAGGISLNLNGKDLDPLGPSGQTVKITLP